MDGITMTSSSQSFWATKRSALMVMTMTALTVNANTGNLSQSLTPNGNSLPHVSYPSVIPVSQERVYKFPKKKDFRARYSRLAKSEWFKNIYNGKTLGEIITVEE